MGAFDTYEPMNTPEPNESIIKKCKNCKRETLHFWGDPEAESTVLECSWCGHELKANYQKWKMEAK